MSAHRSDLELRVRSYIRRFEAAGTNAEQIAALLDNQGVILDLCRIVLDLSDEIDDLRHELAARRP